jgi:hypothetical protein
VERAANTAGSAWQVVLALYVLQPKSTEGLGWRNQKVTSTVGQHTSCASLTGCISVSRVQKPKVFTTALAAVPLGCVIPKSELGAVAGRHPRQNGLLGASGVAMRRPRILVSMMSASCAIVRVVFADVLVAVPTVCTC